MSRRKHDYCCCPKDDSCCRCYPTYGFFGNYGGGFGGGCGFGGWWIWILILIILFFCFNGNDKCRKDCCDDDC
ncbi:hypothetical protein [Clostridium thermarum]|uniref:hypothetical protein n=1 Tax=Clostridium thermarum TaxID=1716543 RepID=UPI00111FD1E4|nr:hypothetical protein [Clostridium thermarum]